jgi:hypothetical protein
LIQYELSAYVEVLNVAVPSMPLPSLTYGAPGAYGSFDIKMKLSFGATDRYPDLRPKVFHLLRRIGNMYLFLKLLDSTLSRQADLSFKQRAFFLGLQPYPSRKPDTVNQSQSQPQESSKQQQQQHLVAAVESSSSSLRPQGFIKPNENTKPVILKSIFDATLFLGQNVEQDRPICKREYQAMQDAVELYAYEPDKRHSLMKNVMQTIAETLRASSLDLLWGGEIPTKDKLMEPTKPSDFARLWSCFQFLACQPRTEELKYDDGSILKVDDFACFGDGFWWAGALILHMLGFKERFLMMDFSFHVANIATLSASVDQDHYNQSTATAAAARRRKKNTNAAFSQSADFQAMLQEIPAFLNSVAMIKKKMRNIFQSLETFYEAPKRSFDFALSCDPIHAGSVSSNIPLSSLSGNRSQSSRPRPAAPRPPSQPPKQSAVVVPRPPSQPPKQPAVVAPRPPSQPPKQPAVVVPRPPSQPPKQPAVVAPRPPSQPPKQPAVVAPRPPSGPPPPSASPPNDDDDDDDDVEPPPPPLPPPSHA